MLSSEEFDITDYSYSLTDTKLYIVNFVEYCYSFKINMQSNYGLYLYFYNPGNIDIDTDSISNKVQLAVEYNSAKEPIDYEKFSLKYCSVSIGDYANLFYKFKILDPDKKIISRVESNARRYDVSGFELMTEGASNAKEYTIGGSYIFSGYAAGYGPDPTADDTLNCVVEDLETIELDVRNTMYRTETSIKGAGYQNQLDSVYFAVPKDFFERYGKLQRIKAEWYEFKTKDIIVTNHNSMYQAMNSYTGYRITSPNLFNTSILYGYLSGGSQVGDMWKYDWTYNGYWDSGYQDPTSYASFYKADSFYYLFYTSNDINEYNPRADIVEIGGIASNELYQYILNYDETFVSGTLPIKSGQISADLFASDIDSYRKVDNEFGKIQYGYSYYDFDVDKDLFNLLSYQDGDPSFWDNLKNYGIWDTIFGRIPDEIGRPNISPIKIINSEDLLGSDSVVSERLLINYHDVTRFKTYYNSNESDNEIVLFRFAATDYFSKDVIIKDNSSGNHILDKAYRAWESVFLDFDIIQLTFNKDGVYKVIPAVSDPIDIVGPITPPSVLPGGCSDASNLLALILGVILLILLAPFLPYIISFIIKVITFPFRLFSDTSKRLKRRR